MTIFKRKKEPDVIWTVALLRQYLRADLTVRESLDSAGQSRYKGQEQSPKSSFKPWSDSKYKTVTKSSTEAFYVGEGAGAASRAPSRPCMFCEQMHWSADCNVCTTLDSMKQRLKGKCFNCLQSGHSIGDCQCKQSCYYCKKQGHHQVLCFKKCST